MKREIGVFLITLIFVFTSCNKKNLRQDSQYNLTEVLTDKKQENLQSNNQNDEKSFENQNQNHNEAATDEIVLDYYECKPLLSMIHNPNVKNGTIVETYTQDDITTRIIFHSQRKKLEKQSIEKGIKFFYRRMNEKSGPVKMLELQENDIVIIYAVREDYNAKTNKYIYSCRACIDRKFDKDCDIYDDYAYSTLKAEGWIFIMESGFPVRTLYGDDFYVFNNTEQVFDGNEYNEIPVRKIQMKGIFTRETNLYEYPSTKAPVLRVLPSQGNAADYETDETGETEDYSSRLTRLTEAIDEKNYDELKPYMLDIHSNFSEEDCDAIVEWYHVTTADGIDGWVVNYLCLGLVLLDMENDIVYKKVNSCLPYPFLGMTLSAKENCYIK